MKLPYVSTSGLGTTWAAVFLCVSTQVVAAKDWRGLTPLRSTSEDVARLLGVSPRGVLDHYEFKEMTVSFRYQYQAGETSCQKYPRSYDVPAETIVAIDLSPNTYVSLKDLALDFTDFRPVLPQSFDRRQSGYSLLDKQEEIALTLNDDLSVDHITYLPSLLDRERFACPDQANTRPATPEEHTLHLSSILYSEIPNLEQRLLSKNILDLMGVLSELVRPANNNPFGYRLKYVLPHSDYLTILNTILRFQIKHLWSPDSPIDLIDWGKICFVIRTLQLQELAIPLSTHLEINDPVVQLRILETLQVLGEQESRHQVVFLLEEKAVHPDVAEAALDTLVAFRADEAISFLEQRLAQGGSNIHEAMRGLALIGNTKSIPGLVRGLFIGDPNLRKIAVQGLTAIGGPTAIEGLVSALDLDDRYNEVRREAVKGLIALQAAEQYPKFWKVIRNQKEFDPRSLAFLALVSIGDAQAIDVFFTELLRSPSRIGKETFQTLKDLDAQVLVVPLIDLLQNHSLLGGTGSASRSTLENIIVFLKEMKAQKAAPILMSLMERDIGTIREHTVHALGELGRKEAIPTLKILARLVPWTWEDGWRLDSCYRQQLQDQYPDGLPPNSPRDGSRNFTMGLCAQHPREPFIAGEAALALLKLGEETLIPEVQARWNFYQFSPGKFFQLNALINPRLWRYFQTVEVQGYNRAPIHLVAQAYKKEASIKIVLPDKALPEESKFFASISEKVKWPNWPNRGTRISLIQGIQEIADFLHMTFIVEETSVKILTESQVKTWWKDQLQYLIPNDGRPS